VRSSSRISSPAAGSSNDGGSPSSRRRRPFWAILCYKKPGRNHRWVGRSEEHCMSLPAFIYDERFHGYDLGAQHPLKPRRLQLTRDLCAAYGLLEPAVSAV